MPLSLATKPIIQGVCHYAECHGNTCADNSIFKMLILTANGSILLANGPVSKEASAISTVDFINILHS